jgi:hypothetical protein
MGTAAPEAAGKEEKESDGVGALGGGSMSAQHKRPGARARAERKRRAENRPRRVVVVSLVRGNARDEFSPGRLVATGELVEVAI